MTGLGNGPVLDVEQPRLDIDVLVGAQHPEGERAVLTSINISPPEQEIFNVKMMSRWEEIEKNEDRIY